MCAKIEARERERDGDRGEEEKKIVKKSIEKYNRWAHIYRCHIEQ